MTNLCDRHVRCSHVQLSLLNDELYTGQERTGEIEPTCTSNQENCENHNKDHFPLNICLLVKCPCTAR